jgi:ParB family chromosome partitioning protein
MAPEFRRVSLDDIAFDDETCTVTYRPEMAALQRSVAQVGVLTPVHLRQVDGESRLQIVCGVKRLRACQQAVQGRVAALVYAAAELSDEAALLLTLHDNLGCRRLNAVEKGRFLRRLRDVFQYDEAQLVDVFCPLMDLPPRSETLAMYCTFAALEEPLQAAVVDGLMPLEVALWVGEQAPLDRQSLLALFTGSMKLGSNRGRECMALIDDICHRDGIGPAALLQALDVPALLDDATLAGPQKIECLRRALRMRRYPRLSEHERRFQDAVRELRLPSYIRLQPPPHFDGQQYQVAFHFANREALQACAQRLLDAAADPALGALLTLL